MNGSADCPGSSSRWKLGPRIWVGQRAVSKKKMDDSQLGAYSAPGLLMQESTTRVLLEPIARFAPGVDGVVDLYLMPAYDDIATLYFYDGCWHLHYWFPGMPMAGDLWQTKGKPLSKESVMEVLDEMRKNAA